MEGPPAPQDQNLRNIIDKLAEFVARNGLEFEQMTRNKQQNNPKFAFLYGGEFFSYYQWRKEKERERERLGNMPPQGLQTGQPPPIWQNNAPTLPNVLPQVQQNPNTAQIEAINVQQNKLREQIKQSELNLQAQHSVLLTQQQSQIDAAVKIAQAELLQRQADEAGIKLSDFDAVLQPIIESCTKDSISNGKSWILQHTSDESKCQVVSQYLLKKVMTEGAPFTQKLHLIYLVNDVIHHCVRKNSDELKKFLENVVIPMFCNAQMCASEEQRAKLTKLLTLWESKANFFDACVISKLKSPPSSIQEYQASLLTQHAAIIAPLTQASKATYENYQQQHQVFADHAARQIQILETQKQQLEQQGIQMLLQNQQQQHQIPVVGQPGGQNPVLNPQLSSIIQQIQMQLSNGNANNANNNSNNLPPGVANSPLRNIPTLVTQAPPSKNPQRDDLYSHVDSPQQQRTMNDYSLPPPQIPDMSRPPPGIFDQPPPSTGNSAANSEPPPSIVEDLTPKLPYFDLPAGLMVPLIRLEDYNYKPLDPALIKLPAPVAPSERLLSAVEAFYALPSHERPRDGEGWEKLGLYEYFKVKNSAKKQKEEEIAQGVRERSRSPTPIDPALLKPPRRKNKRCYRSKSRTRSRSRSKSKSKSPSPAMKSRSPSPPSRNRNRRQRSITPPSRHKNIRERERSISPPMASFAGASYTKTASEFIEESNKGHQMLMKMGWGGSGKGLGVAAQGIDQPISAGEVRDKQDLYKGVGASTQADPYESFRRNKANSFIHRIRSRDERS
ncbi:calcium homeostasis endoplasmic reticulum protein [Culicoides brevitarsis]|uniref:calcium homeostasis endoplasmic reticulum protein n=1 Tax=Culicoides brevitarsis TaxID=469753 RepID=UPI00307B837D